MIFYPFKWTKIALKLENQKTMTKYEGGQDTSAYQISGQSFHAFPSECANTPN